ncbi:MAG: DUF2155 domain-containing protein [Pseudomonadota bacterium]|nr:DUF2155 domain-containing protein [Pseudomonadota bacterium]
MASSRRLCNRGYKTDALRAAAALFTVTVTAMALSQAVAAPHDTVVIQGLDKVTARVTTIEAPVGQTFRLGTLEIIARHCEKRPPEEMPESTAFLDIWEIREGEPAVSLFRGWMFASSPALSVLEHPVYDVWVVDCKGKIGAGGQPQASEEAQ